MHSNESITRPNEEGSAFVISILVLFVLSVLGVALMLTTVTEKDIAVNYRWGEQAFFNADAGLGYFIITSTAFFQTPLAYAALIILSLMGIILFQLVVVAERVFFPWSAGNAAPINA